VDVVVNDKLEIYAATGTDLAQQAVRKAIDRPGRGERGGREAKGGRKTTLEGSQKMA